MNTIQNRPMFSPCLKLILYERKSQTALCLAGCERKQVFVESLMVYNQEELVINDGYVDHHSFVGIF